MTNNTQKKNKILSQCNAVYTRDLKGRRTLEQEKPPDIQDKDTILRQFPNGPALSDGNQFTNKNDPIWYDDVEILYKDNNWKLFFPNKNMSTSEILNSFLRFSVYFFIIVSIWERSISSVFVPLSVALFTCFLYKNQNEKEREKYTGNECGETTKPTEHNPFMNTLLTEIGKDEERPEAHDTTNPDVKKSMEYYFNKNLYKDANDLYNKNNSQSRFFTMPNTSEFGVNNGDSVSFANWLYNKPAPTCKEDSLYCTNSWSTTYDNYKKVRSHRQLPVPYDWPNL